MRIFQNRIDTSIRTPTLNAYTCQSKTIWDSYMYDFQHQFKYVDDTFSHSFIAAPPYISQLISFAKILKKTIFSSFLAVFINCFY